MAEHAVYYEVVAHTASREELENRLRTALAGLVEQHIDGPIAYGTGMALASGMVEVLAGDSQGAREHIADTLSDVGDVAQLAVMPALVMEGVG